MEPPDTSIQRGFADTVSRRADAIRSGLVAAIGGVPVHLHAPEQPCALAMAELLAGLVLTGDEPQCSLTFELGEASVPARSADDELVDGETWQSGTEFAFRHSSGLVAVADSTTARISGFAAGLRWPFRRLFHPTLAHLLAHRGRYVLHAAAVVYDDDAILVLGDTGRGKSTVAMAALRAGHEVLGDDLVVLVPLDDGSYELIGVPRPMAVPGDVAATGGGSAVAGDPRSRVEIPPATLSTAGYPLRSVVVSDHAARSEATIEPVGSALVMGALLGAFTATRNPVLRSSFFPHASILSRLPAWRLRLVRDADVRLAAAAAALDDVQAFVRRDQS
jgi:hypothetical protein